MFNLCVEKTSIVFGRDICFVLCTNQISLCKNNSCVLHRQIQNSFCSCYALTSRIPEHFGLRVCGLNQQPMDYHVLPVELFAHNTNTCSHSSNIPWWSCDASMSCVCTAKRIHREANLHMTHT